MYCFVQLVTGQLCFLPACDVRMLFRYMTGLGVQISGGVSCHTLIYFANIRNVLAFAKSLQESLGKVLKQRRSDFSPSFQESKLKTVK